MAGAVLTKESLAMKGNCGEEGLEKSEGDSFNPTKPFKY